MPVLQQLARDRGVELALLGLAGGDAIEFDGQLRVGLADLRKVWEEALLALSLPPGGGGPGWGGPASAPSVEEHQL
jgi:hypothetical protein